MDVLCNYEDSPCTASKSPIKPKIPKRGNKSRQGSQVEMLSNATLRDHVKTSHDAEFLSKALSKHFVFTNLSIESRVKLISKMNLYHYTDKQCIVKQSSYGSHFFVIAKGKVEVIIDGKQVNILSAGESFGELALLHDFPRSASIITMTNVYVWVLYRDDFKEAIKKININNYKENEKFLEALPLFSNLTHEQKSNLLETLSETKYRPGKKIVSEGEMGGVCYFIKEGKVVCLKKGEVVGEICQGGYFGEQSLLTNSVRTATVVAKTEAKCIGLSREDLEKVLGSALEKIILQNSILIAFSRSPVLKDLDKHHWSKLLMVMRTLHFEKDSEVISAGTAKNSCIYLVLQGNIKSTSGEIVNALECLGDLDVLRKIDELYSESYMAQEESHIGIISKELFEKTLGIHCTNLTQEEVRALKQVSILKTLHHHKFEAVVKSFVETEFLDQEIIVKQNSPGEFLFVIKEGKVDIIQDGVNLRTITKYDYFGERSLLFDEARTASVVANGNVICWTLSRSDFLKNLSMNLRKRLMKRIEMQDTSVDFNNLKFVKILGRGTFGTVFLVADTEKSRLYALKVLLKENIERFELQTCVLLETHILMNLDNDMVLKLVKSMEDKSYIYLLMEYVKGTCMFDALRIMDLLPEQDSRFYTVCLIVILEYLHEREVVYRDLKPENIIIDEEGYPKLIDFGCSKIIQDRTYTVIGTPHYMAPEIIIGKGYGFYVDYWSLGIMLYEFLFGTVPFGHDQDDPYSIYQSILTRTLVFSNTIKTTNELRDLIDQLLCPNPVKRNSGSGDRLKQHPWFEGIVWESYYGKEVRPPYVPKLEEIDPRRVETSISLEQVIFRECLAIEDD
ncbi:hypothetical protein SteCoe_7468 [Stentor coeruleus]|uniref:cGMP-dependent protein kinase n=1 Tax=Stentor coeruleus TaxID=5963 RepID=A0A1R2CME5_9CILI|nr:hypothetical protein SteCoe_7468 [Stentor coeruleus]